MTDTLGWVFALVGFGILLPGIGILALAFCLYISYRFFFRRRVSLTQRTLGLLSLLYILLYFWAQRFI